MIYWLPLILILPYIIFLLKIYRSLLKIKPFIVSALPGTFVSVVVACRNEEQHLPHLLQSISDQDYPNALFELIIVDDNSTDRTHEIASDFRGIPRVKIITNKESGKKQALRTGINNAAGNLIITTDADCIMGKKWVRTIAAFYENCKPDMIICPVKVEPMSGYFGRFQELEFLSLQGITAGSAFQRNGVICNGANLAFTKDAYLNNAGNLHFEIPTGDDIFFLHSLKKHAGSRILWLESPDATVSTMPSPTPGSYFRQRRRWVSKSKAYHDPFSIFLGTATFTVILLQASLLVAGLFNPAFLISLLALTVLKSVPDFLILLNTSLRYGRKELMKWFLPSQIIYPFYVAGIVFSLLIFPEKRYH